MLKSSPKALVYFDRQSSSRRVTQSHPCVHRCRAVLDEGVLTVPGSKLDQTSVVAFSSRLTECSVAVELCSKRTRADNVTRGCSSVVVRPKHEGLMVVVRSDLGFRHDVPLLCNLSPHPTTVQAALILRLAVRLSPAREDASLYYPDSRVRPMEQGSGLAACHPTSLEIPSAAKDAARPMMPQCSLLARKIWHCSSSPASLPAKTWPTTSTSQLASHQKCPSLVRHLRPQLQRGMLGRERGLWRIRINSKSYGCLSSAIVS